MSLAPAPADLDCAVARMRRILAILRELTELGMELARGWRELGALAAADRFARIARAVRQLIALEVRLAQALDEADRGAWPTDEAARALNALADEVQDNEAVETLETLVDGAERIETERLRERLDDWRAERSVETDFCRRSVAEIVTRACRDLGVRPDPAIVEDPSMTQTLAQAVDAYAAWRGAAFLEGSTGATPWADLPPFAGRTPNRLADARPPPR